jgi:HPt (histidine-containing phosphotransfer) domain-containing protein
MTVPSPVGFLDFFVLEASDYIDQLDAQLKAGAGAGLDADALQRVARALRGSATMAKLPAFAEMAAGMERVGRALREGAVSWDAALGGVLVATVDDCKLLLRNVRAWGPGDDARARARVAELTRYAPVRAATPVAAPTTTSHDSYLATEASNIGAGLELLATRPSDRDAAGNVLGRVRALRGIASVKDHASFADVLEAAERAAHPLELGEPVLSAERVALLSAAATLLRGVAAAMRAGKEIEPTNPDIARFAAALDAMQEHETGAERVVPIAELFFNDGGATLVEAAANPPTSPAERFRLEVVSQGEHLRRLVSDARGARDDLARERVRRGLRQALRSLRLAAESFGEVDVANFVASHNDAVVRLDARALDSLDEVATLLAQPGGGAAAGSLKERLVALQTARGTPASTAIAPAVTAPRPPAPVSRTPSGMMTPIAGAPIMASASDRIRAATPPRPAAAPVVPPLAGIPGGTRHPTPAAGAAALSNLLDRGISTLDTLPKTPLSNPITLAEQPAVPIDVLLYRGRAAIERARVIRDELRKNAGPLDPRALSELFDLLDLALTD